MGTLRRLVQALALFVVIGLCAAGSANAEGDDLVAASAVGDLSRVKALLAAKVNVNARWPNGASALTMASGAGRLEVVQALLAAGADVNARWPNGASALTVA